MTTSPERIHARLTSPGSTVLSPIQRVRRWLCNVLAGVCAPLLVLAAISASAQAQTVTFAGAQTTIGSGWALPIGVAVDAAGNAFIADAYNNQVVEIPAGRAPRSCGSEGIQRFCSRPLSVPRLRGRLLPETPFPSVVLLD